MASRRYPSVGRALAGILACLAFGVARAEDDSALKHRLRELEKENQQLIETTEAQMQEILELRRRIKEGAFETGETDVIPVAFSDRWRFSAGIILFDIFDSGDAIESGGFTTEGSLVGYRVSAGKGRDRFGVTVYSGNYEFIRNSSPVNEVRDYTRKINDRIDVDMAWLRTVMRDEVGGVGFIVGYKQLMTEKNVFTSERYFDYYDSGTFEGTVDWYMVSLGVFGSTRLLASWPVDFFFSCNGSIGFVEGMVRDQVDYELGGGIQDSFRNESSAAWGFNATAGCHYMPVRNIVLRVGYRGQVLNALGRYAPLETVDKFYDGHQSLFVAVDAVL